MTPRNQLTFSLIGTFRTRKERKERKETKDRMRMRSCMLSKYKRRNERNSWNSITRH